MKTNKTVHLEACETMESILSLFMVYGTTNDEERWCTSIEKTRTSYKEELEELKEDDELNEVQQAIYDNIEELFEEVFFNKEKIAVFMDECEFPKAFYADNGKYFTVGELAHKITSYVYTEIVKPGYTDNWHMEGFERVGDEAFMVSFGS